MGTAAAGSPHTRVGGGRTRSRVRHLAIEALKASLLQQARESGIGNDVRSKQFSERINLMTKYTNQRADGGERDPRVWLNLLRKW